MSSKSVNWILVVLTVASLAFGVYQYNRSNQLTKKTIEWKSKYEEAIIDMEDAHNRIEKMEENVQKALRESEEHRKMAEVALAELQKRKGKK
jgi:multidrug resistance efflux pump